MIPEWMGLMVILDVGNHKNAGKFRLGQEEYTTLSPQTQDNFLKANLRIYLFIFTFF